MLNVFRGYEGGNVRINYTTGNQRVAFPALPANVHPNSTTLLLQNLGTDVVFVETGDGAVSVAATGANAGIPVLPNAIVVIRPTRQDDTHIAAICATTGGTLFISRGVGA